MKLTPITIKRANELVLEWHRHNKPTQGGRFAIGAIHEDGIVGVAIVGRPLARMLAGDTIAEVTRLCTTDEAPKGACSFLYGACRRIWFAMGGTRLITYTLKTESGASLRGAGWTPTADTATGQQWGRTSRPRNEQTVVAAPKIHWETNQTYKGPYPRVFICPDCASELEPDERANGVCKDCAKDRYWSVQTDQFPIE